MRKLNSLEDHELDRVNDILEQEYQYHDPLPNWQAVEYQVFTKSRCIFSGKGAVEVYLYLKSVDIDILED